MALSSADIAVMVLIVEGMYVVYIKYKYIGALYTRENLDWIDRIMGKTFFF